MTKEEFESWLRSEEYKPYIYRGKNETVAFIKVPKNENFDYLYRQYNYRGSVLERNCGFEYGGIYCKTNGLVYDCYRPFREIDFKLTPTPTTTVMMENVTAQVCRAVEAIIGNDKSKLTVSDITSEREIAEIARFKEYTAKDQARAMFLGGGNSDSIAFECRYEFGGWNEDNLLEYILNPEVFIGKETARYLTDGQEEMLSQFLENEMLKAELTRIEGNPNNTLHRIKDIMAAMDTVPDAKTVTVRIDTPEKAFSFKTLAADLRRDPRTTYSTWDIASPDRLEFEHLFGRGFSYSPDDIIRISHGKTTLYSAEPAYMTESDDESETAEESDGFTQSM